VDAVDPTPEATMKKKDILLGADYRYNFDRNIYFNRTAKKAFSLEFVDDKDEMVIRQSIQEPTNGSGWKFYFNADPSEGVKRILEQVLG
jgi:hypothetical protein